MRIFLISQQSQHSYPVPAYRFWETYFKNGISEAGHTWIETKDADWARGLISLEPAMLSAWRAAEWDRTLKAISLAHARERIDLVLSYLFPQQVEPSAIEQIQQLGIPCVNFFCDNVREFSAVPASYRRFDLHWVPEARAQSLYRTAGLRFVYAPMPVWTPPQQRCLPASESNEVTFIGSHDVLRESLLSDAFAGGLMLRLHGPGWENQGRNNLGDPSRHSPPRFLLQNQIQFVRDHGVRGLGMKLSYKLHRSPPRDWLQEALRPPVFGEEYFRVTRESAVTVGINRYPSFRHSFRNAPTYSRLRDIEAPMLGACYLTEAAPGLEDLYELGSEIETYRDAQELVEKAKALIQDPARRRKLRERAQKRALSEHTVARSLEKIADKLGLP